jgi:hypothetical protein
VSKVRLGWIQCQRDTLVKATGLEIEGQRTVPGYKYNAYRIASNSNASDVRFGSLGYADWARDSYAEFRRLKQAGNIAQPTRFQVCLPAPFDVCSAFIVPSDMKAVWLACEHAMAAELEKIAQAILAEELAVQWGYGARIYLRDGEALRRAGRLAEGAVPQLLDLHRPVAQLP